MRKKLYLANPYGFSKQTKTLLHEFIEIFNNLNVEVFEPFERSKLLTQQSEWAYDVARSNFPRENNPLTFFCYTYCIPPCRFDFTK